MEGKLTYRGDKESKEGNKNKNNDVEDESVINTAQGLPDKYLIISSWDYFSYSPLSLSSLL